MLRFKEFIENLLENRLEFLKQKYKDFDTSHDTLAKHHDPESIINHFSNNADPSTNKKYTQWILQQYKNKKIRQEDHPSIKETLNNFEKYKNKLPNKDINNYDIHSLEDSLEPHIGEIASNKEQKRYDKSGAKLIHSENGVTIHHLGTKEAACHYGKGTKWCTSGDDDNKFDEYNKEGPLYLAHDKHGNKYQFHFNSNQFMDSKNKDIDLHKFVQENPELKNVKEFQGLHDEFPLTKENKQHYINKLNKDSNVNPDEIKRAIDYKFLTPQHIDNIVDNPNNTATHNSLVDSHIDKKLQLTPENINKIIENKASTAAHDNLVWGHRIKQLQLTPEQINKIIENKASTNAHNSLVDGHINKELQLTPKQINKIIENKASAVAHHSLVLGHRNKQLQLTPKQINKIIENKDSTAAHNSLVYGHIDKDLQLTPENINKIIENKDSTAAHNSLVNGHKNKKLQLTPEQINNIIENKKNTIAHNSLVNGHIDKELQLTPKQINKIIENKASTNAHDGLVWGHIYKQLQLTPEQLQKLRNIGHNI